MLFRSGAVATGLASSAAEGLSPLISVVPIVRIISGVGAMQLSVFTGLTFFLSAFGVGVFLSQREKRCHWRLIAMGYSSGQVFWGEGLAYLAINGLMIGGFHGVFALLYPEFMPVGMTQTLALLGLMTLQSLLAAGYALMFLGLSRSQKTFSQFYFAPAFVLSFLGGAMFPVDRLAGSGLYEWMPNYVLSTQYTAIFEGRLVLDGYGLLQWGALLGAALLLTLVGRWRFKLEEV